MKFTGQKYSYIHTKWGFIGSKHRASWCRNKESGGVGEVKKKREKRNKESWRRNTGNHRTET